MPVLYRRGLLESTRVTMLSPDVISPNPDQPRRYFDPDGLYRVGREHPGSRHSPAPFRPAKGRRAV